MISCDDIRGTYETIRPHIRRTPVIQADLSELDAPGLPVATLKLEQLQCAGSFKARDAFAAGWLVRGVRGVRASAAPSCRHAVTNAPA